MAAWRAASIATRRAARAVVGRMPPGLADRARGLKHAGGAQAWRVPLLSIVRRGGIPAGVRTFTLADRPDITFVNAQSLVLEQLFWLGEKGWEPELMPWWRHFCARSEVIVELGANVGYYAVQGARAAPHARYIAVEPHPSSVAICRANLELNNVRNVELVAAAAVTDPSLGSVQILVPSDQLAAPTVAFVANGGELPPEMRRGPLHVIDVTAIDVRSLMAGTDLVKLDVEGQEHALLAAAREELVRHRPTLFVELLGGTPALRLVLTEMCEAGGYRCYAPTRDRLVEIPAQSLATLNVQADFATNDVVLTAHPLG